MREITVGIKTIHPLACALYIAESFPDPVPHALANSLHAAGKNAFGPALEP